jgi:hypothetical protein
LINQLKPHISSHKGQLPKSGRHAGFNAATVIKVG